MTLSDRDIHWALTQSSVPPVQGEDPVLPLVDPWNADNLQPASVDLTLHDEFVYYAQSVSDGSKPIKLDEMKDDPPRTHHLRQDRYTIPPLGFILSSTAEWVNIPANLVATVEGKSSLARLGLFVHITAGFIDPGFRGRITLELFNANPRPIEVVAGLRVCQIAFHALSSPADRPYGSLGLGSKYQGQNRTTESRYRG